MCEQQSLRSACAYAQSDQSLCLSFEYSMDLRLLIEHRLEFLSLKVGCSGSCESTFVEIAHCWKSHVTAHIKFQLNSPKIEEYKDDDINLSQSAFMFTIHPSGNQGNRLRSAGRCFPFLSKM